MDKIMFCTNCGAKIEDEKLDKCAYCGYIIERGAEEKYMRQLHSINEKLDSVDEAEVEQYRKMIAGNLKKVGIIIGVVLVVILLLVAAVSCLENTFSEELSPEEQKAEMLWERDYFPGLDALYEAQDYEALAAAVGSDEVVGHAIYKWEHYYFASNYADYMQVRDSLEQTFDKYNGQPEDWRISLNIWYLFKFYYREYDMDTTINDEEKAILDECREEILPILYNRLEFTDEEMDGFLDKYDRRKEGYLALPQIDKVIKEYKYRMH